MHRHTQGRAPHIAVLHWQALHLLYCRAVTSYCDIAEGDMTSLCNVDESAAVICRKPMLVQNCAGVTTRELDFSFLAILRTTVDRAAEKIRVVATPPRQDGTATQTRRSMTQGL